MSQFLQIMLSGLATGSIYALVAIGFTLIWQSAQTVNFAQGEFVMVPAFLVLVGMNFLGMPLWIAIVFALLVSIVLLGYVFKKLVVEPILPSGGISLIIATMALGIFLKESVKEFYGAEAQPFPPLFPTDPIHILGAVVSLQDIINLAIALGIVVLLTLFLNRTRTGRCMQAAAQNPAVAEILGVNVKRMILYAFLINAALAAVASFLITPVYLAKFSNGEVLGLIAFIAAIVGGFNQIRGALVGGLLIGVLDNLTATYVTAEYRAALPLVLLIGIILIRPQGIMGTPEGRAV
ncbi:branched-chain amino acid ABC transporter permease [Pelagibacterium halotolerans]|uniref:High-affinity branched-chain amino acid transport system permease protein LivH n=1 Tax=Pelagibacterium halotolerans (strain DSM 22347 / JCM 15775 / CGMCC 1.7692 / B2) TaxID=1082931 RepID=G4R6L9_PELHB|nr:branched-chain amino acid ABC transporter permease [Pelagibacterium halotolerans]AEQ51215.1 high-affinity branched-chain amino acid transport system permease protein LivH [Pelagibacterium halotolerans B2]QJR18922.1 branched-chain amino acid ABC transporter permease [Pelagibacterium halotolerans]SEA68125.1 amino acid/amide ABC transporter membrane protein 1, HAAT family [Pelagibacterium halotolerans]